MSTVLVLMTVLLDSVVSGGWILRSDGRAAPLLGLMPRPAVAARHRAHHRRAELPGESVVDGDVDPLPEAVHAAGRQRWGRAVAAGDVALGGDHQLAFRHLAQPAGEAHVSSPAGRARPAPPSRSAR